MITLWFRTHLERTERFSESEYGSADNIREMMLKFDAEDKPRFSPDTTRGFSIDFRLHSRNDPDLELKKGRPFVSL